MRCRVNGEGVIERWHESCGARGFPEKANPNSSLASRMPGHSPPTHPARGGGLPGDAAPYPAKCDPRGRRGPLTDDQRCLVVRYLPLARALARKLGRSESEFEELISAAYLALVEAAQSYDPAYTVKFTTFAYYRIHGALIACRRSRLRLGKGSHSSRSPVFQPLDPHDETHESIFFQESEPRVSPLFEQIEALESYFRRLPRDQATACRLIYLDGKSQEEVADLLGFSKSYLSRLHQTALAALKRRCL
jgi:RNA polymerase sigma factor (sigma-70 family)